MAEVFAVLDNRSGIEMATGIQTDELLRVLKSRREYCRAMMQLAEEQQVLISQNKTSELLQLIAQKQRVIDGLIEFGRAFGGLTDYWKQIRDGLAANLRAECDAILAESEVLLAAALEREAQGTRELTQQRDAKQRELRKVGQTLETRAALGAGLDGPQSGFLDVSR